MLNKVNLKNKKAFLFDIDGTLSLGNTLFNGSKDLLDFIDNMGFKSYFITNNSTSSTLSYIEKFKAWDISTDYTQFITAGYMAKKYLLTHYKNKKAYVIGTKSYIDELRKAGITVTEAIDEDVDLILTAFDNELTYQKLSGACSLLAKKDIPFLATNPDLRCPSEFGFIPDCGSICQMIENSVDVKPKYLGKPNKELVEICLKDCSCSKEECIVFGDRLYTDIACGINAGVDTVAVLTGETSIEEISNSVYKPNLVYKNIKDFYDDFILKLKK